MANKKKQQEPEVPEPIVIPVISQLYLQELFNRTELERQAAMNRVRADVGAPDGMAYNPQAGAFVAPPTPPVPVELLPDDS